MLKLLLLMELLLKLRKLLLADLLLADLLLADLLLADLHEVDLLVGDLLLGMGGHRHPSQCWRYPISDIDICYSDIGDKYVGLKNVILISEVFLYRHQSSFRYPALKKKIYSSRQIRIHAPWKIM
jgi:hypothetical protein